MRTLFRTAVVCSAALAGCGLLAAPANAQPKPELSPVTGNADRGLILFTNIDSLRAQNNLNASSTGMSTAIMNLGSGKRVNTARDDAAGLPIVDAMTSQINGLTQASRNAADGISLLQTTEGAEAQMVDNLQRIYTLTVQGLNGTNSVTGVASLQAEIDQRLAEIDRIAAQAQFNGLYPPATDGLKAMFQIGPDAADTITVPIEKMNTSTLGSRT